MFCQTPSLSPSKTLSWISMHFMLSQSPPFFFIVFSFILFHGSDFTILSLSFTSFILLPHLFCYWVLPLYFFFGYVIIYLWLFEFSLLNISFILLILHSILFQDLDYLYYHYSEFFFRSVACLHFLLSCSSGVPFCPFIWNIFLCCFILSNLLCLQSHRLQVMVPLCFWGDEMRFPIC